MKTLRVRLCPLAELGADSALNYEIIDSDRRVLDRGIAVPGALPRLARVELVIAALDVLLLDSAPPRLSGARLRAALPALAEPMVLGDVERSFVAASKPDSAGRVTLAVLDRALFKRALDLFARLKIEPVSVVPEPLTLPAGRGRWRLRLGDRYGCVRMGERLGIACSLSGGTEPPVELRLALEQAGPARPEAIEVEGECDTAAWTAALGVQVLAVAPDRSYRAPVVLELLQYEFAPRIADWRAWRLPAVLAVALALVWIAGLNIDAWLKHREAQHLRSQMNAAFREAFPQVPVVLDPLAQMRRAVANMRSGAGTGDAGDFVSLAASFAQAVQAEAESVRLIEYRERALQVRFEPGTVDKAKRETLVDRLSKAGLVAKFSDSTLSVRRGGGT
ncbi:MAG: type II secretion system protein GspL [Betaproteobacteria bacterium]|nr:type II secretion system protein GspL [Betaproteobacteria bacterium]